MKSDHATRSIAGRRDQAVVALFALAASLSGVLNDFVFDDVPIIRANARLHSLTHWWEILSKPYWPPPYVPQLYRPAASLTLAVEYFIGGGAPLVFRLVSIALYVAGSVAVYRLASRLVGRMPALAAAVLFAVHPVHVEAVALGVNQGELVVGLVSVLLATRYLDRRREGGLRARDWALIAGGYLVAALFKENGAVLPALLLVVEATLIDADSLVQRVSALWRGYAVLALVAAAVLWARIMVVPAGWVGASTAVALRGLGLGDRVLTMLQVVPMWLRLLVWPQTLRADYAPEEITRPAAMGLPEFAGIALVIAVFVLIVRWRRTLPVASFGLAWCTIALLPVSNLVPTGIVLAERTLYTPSVGFLIALAALAQWVAREERWPRARVRKSLLAACAVMITLGLIKSANRSSLWNSAHIVVDPRAAKAESGR